MGQTASGKTDLAEQIADHLNARLINADSFQVYRGMDIGTAKSERKADYDLLDIKNPDEPCGVGEWVQLAAPLLANLHRSGTDAVVVGGSGLNVRALFERYDTMTSPPDPLLREALNARFAANGLESLVNELSERDPKAAATTDLKNPVRVIRALERAIAPTKSITFELPTFRQVKFAIATPVETINQRISDRVGEMLKNGWLQEVESLKQAGYGPNAPGFRAHGYRELWSVLSGEMTLEAAVESIVLQVRRYAKRQKTWLKTEPGLTMLDAGSALEQARSKLFALGEGADENGQDH